MQGHGHEKIGMAKDLRTGPSHPAPVRPGGLAPIAVLELQDQRLAAVVVHEHRPCLALEEAVAGAFAANCTLAQIDLEGHAADGATRPVNET